MMYMIVRTNNQNIYVLLNIMSIIRYCILIQDFTMLERWRLEAEYYATGHCSDLAQTASWDHEV